MNIMNITFQICFILYILLIIHFYEFRYYRLPLPMEGAPLEETFDSFVNILRVRTL